MGDDSVKLRRNHLLWKNIISSQLDADRADYLLRDSKHLGISYGYYDKDRLVNTLTIGTDNNTGATALGIEEGGWHVAESLVIARYHMFTQVYFHKTRRAYDHHIGHAMKEVIKKTLSQKGYFPPPTSKENVDRYIEYDDWNIYGYIKEGYGDKHGNIITNRNHDRCAFETSELPNENELMEFNDIFQCFSKEIEFRDAAQKSWYKIGKEDIMVLSKDSGGGEHLIPLSQVSSVVKSIQPIRKNRLYTSHERKRHLMDKIRQFRERGI